MLNAETITELIWSLGFGRATWEYTSNHEQVVRVGKTSPEDGPQGAVFTGELEHALAILDNGLSDLEHSTRYRLKPIGLTMHIDTRGGKSLCCYSITYDRRSFLDAP